MLEQRGGPAPRSSTARRNTSTPARLAVSPQCGFASTLKGNLVTEDDQWRKLDLVSRVARRFWA